MIIVREIEKRGKEEGVNKTSMLWFDHVVLYQALTTALYGIYLAVCFSSYQIELLGPFINGFHRSIFRWNSYMIICTNCFESQRNRSDASLPSSAASFLYATEVSDGKNESLSDEWDLVEHPTFPPPPSQSEDVEHWTRAMFIDAKKKWSELTIFVLTVSI